MIQEKIPTLLIVDDEERNLRLMKAMIAPENFHIITVTNGFDAIRSVQDFSPDLILLDVMMPELDGFEVCRRIKNDNENRMIPILMVTALNEKEDRIKAMEVGADDFLNKPIDKTEFLLRVKSLLRIKSYHDQVSGNLLEIQEKNQKLTKLEHVKDELIHMIVHDLNIPLTSSIGCLEMVLLEREKLTELHTEWIIDSMNQSKFLAAMIKNILDVNKMEEGKLSLNKEMTDVSQLTNQVIELLKGKIDGKKLTVDLESAEKEATVYADPDLIRRVIANLLDNAIRHTPSGKNIQVIIDHHSEDQQLCCRIQDSGKGLRSEHHQVIFEKYKQIHDKDDGALAGRSGLGLVFCRMAVEAHGGEIWVESEGENKGTTFSFLLPLDHMTEKEQEDREEKYCTRH